MHTVFYKLKIYGLYPYMVLYIVVKFYSSKNAVTCVLGTWCHAVGTGYLMPCGGYWAASLRRATLIIHLWLSWQPLSGEAGHGISVASPRLGMQQTYFVSVRFHLGQLLCVAGTPGSRDRPSPYGAFPVRRKRCCLQPATPYMWVSLLGHEVEAEVLILRLTLVVRSLYRS